MLPRHLDIRARRANMSEVGFEASASIRKNLPERAARWRSSLGLMTSRRGGLRHAPQGNQGQAPNFGKLRDTTQAFQIAD